MSDLAGPPKELKLNLDLLPPQRDGEPKISHIPNVDRISEQHKWIVGALASGFTQAEVAKMFDVSPSHVGQVATWRHPELDAVRISTQRRIADSVEDLTTRIAATAGEALSRTVEIMRGTDVANARLAAKDILDRAGYAPVKKTAAVTATVPSAEFVDAVQRMSAADEVARQRDEWAFKPPVKVVDPSPSTSAEIAQANK